MEDRIPGHWEPSRPDSSWNMKPTDVQSLPDPVRIPKDRHCPSNKAPTVPFCRLSEFLTGFAPFCASDFIFWDSGLSTDLLGVEPKPVSITVTC